MVKPLITESDGGVAFTVKVVPGSSRTCISGLLEGMVKVKVAAPPEKGKANQCLVAFLAKRLHVRKNNVTIVSGVSTPVKKLRIAGVAKEKLLREFGLENST